MLLVTEHTYRRGLGATQGERRPPDAHHQRISAEPHARQDFATCPGDESEIAQARQQRGGIFGSVFEHVRGDQSRDHGAFTAA